MNILFVADVSIANVIGGAERVLFEQSTRLAKRGHDVHILTRRLPEHKKDRDTIQNVTEWRYDADQKSSISFIRATMRNSRPLFEFLNKRYSFDCINFHQPFSAFGVIQSPVSKRIRKIYTCHSLSFEEFVSRNTIPDIFYKKGLYLINIFVRRWIEKRALKGSNEIVALSQFTRDRIKRTYRIPSNKITVISGGVDLERFFPADNKEDIRRRLDIPPGKVILFTVRNIVQRMGLENLIAAIHQAIKIAPDIYLVLGGDGPLKENLIDQTERLGIRKYISFTGFITEEDLPDYYRMADIFVLSTLELEGFGLVTLESMASGVPVLGTPVGGTKEILYEFDPGFLFKDTDPYSMADLIIDTCRKIKENPESWDKISHQCRIFVASNFSWEKNVDLLEKKFWVTRQD